jgi:hypothetical protein
VCTATQERGVEGHCRLAMTSGKTFRPDIPNFQADGQALLTAWRSLRHCGSPKEAEAEACLEGMRLVTEWIQQPTCVESDCLSLTNALNNGAKAGQVEQTLSQIFKQYKQFSLSVPFTISTGLQTELPIA